MKSISAFAIFVASFAVSSCHFKTAPEIPGVSGSVDGSEITLGGVLAENRYRLELDKSHPFEEAAVESVSFHDLENQFKMLKESGATTPTENYRTSWRVAQNLVFLNFERLTEQDLASWGALNDELLKYFGSVCFADELERLFYNSRYAGIVNDSILKLTCYTRRYDRIYVNLYTNSTFDFVHTTGGNVRLIQDTDYPNDGKISLKFEVEDKRYVDLFVRIPEWTQFASVTGKGVKYPVHPGEYTEIATKWKSGDRVEIVLGMKPELIQGKNDKFGFEFGPLFMTYETDSLGEAVSASTDPMEQLKLVSPVGKMPTFTFSCNPEQTLVLQPFYAETNDGRRTRWIQRGN